MIKQPLLAQTFGRSSQAGRKRFIVASSASESWRRCRRRAAILSEEDLAEYRPEWQEPISTDYRDYTIACPPLPCSGIQYLETFNLLEGYDLAATGQNSAETIHLFAEAMKLAIADRIAYTTHPGISADKLLSPQYADERRELIDAASAARSDGERFTGPLPGWDDRAGRSSATPQGMHDALRCRSTPRATPSPSPRVSAMVRLQAGWRATPG